MIVDPTRIILAGCWAALMFIYLLGDVLRIYAGHATPGQLAGRPATEWMWVVAALFMLIPIAMMLLSLVVPHGPLVWATVIVVVFLVVFNLFSLPYEGVFDNLLIGVSFAVNALTVWQVLAWRPLAA